MVMGRFRDMVKVQGSRVKKFKIEGFEGYVFEDEGFEV
jgi:hypothetical protein